MLDNRPFLLYNIHMKSKDYVIREYWEDDTETTYISREKTEQWALERAAERYKNIKHVIGLNGPNRFELVGVKFLITNGIALVNPTPSLKVMKIN